MAELARYALASRLDGQCGCSVAAVWLLGCSTWGRALACALTAAARWPVATVYVRVHVSCVYAQLNVEHNDQCFLLKIQTLTSIVRTVNVFCDTRKSLRDDCCGRRVLCLLIALSLNPISSWHWSSIHGVHCFQNDETSPWSSTRTLSKFNPKCSHTATAMQTMSQNGLQRLFMGLFDAPMPFKNTFLKALL